MSRISKIVLSAVLAVLSGMSLHAQESAYGAFSPYSVYGIGDLTMQGGSFSRGMGGVGIATRYNRYLNMVNPAAVTARDTLSFMADMTLESQNKLFRQGDITSANNTFNISNMAVSFPIWRKSAFSVGLSSFSDVGYKFSHTDIDENGIWTSSAMGTGSIYQLTLGVGAQFGRLAVGAQGLYYFGSIEKASQRVNSNTTFRNFSNGYSMHLNGFSGKFGVQWDQPLSGGLRLTAGATYRLGTSLKGEVTDYNFATISSIRDTIGYNVTNGKQVRIADEIGVGVALRKGQNWMVEVNYLRSDWTGTGMDTSTGFANIGTAKFSAAKSQSIRAGFEMIPNINDARYYLRRCTYRGGIYYDQAYYKLDGNTVGAIGVTFGVTLPVFRLYNGLSIGVDLGQKGSSTGNMTRERYAKFVIGFNLHDIWFRKIQFD